ncbi:lipid IV(A) 3-deoxy-D-manno-octulosonic acid transferase [Acidithiobacillus sp. IBUN Pt1247-S3]|uniref:lipid IV(A) 3-deoxy-D-manno-octulosonic acid transferase n=1 Tax=Acidithiobacillus sp. IBUN Pt1247-S3 TaxID=3166642 RepID=UPI0034E3D3AA
MLRRLYAVLLWLLTPAVLGFTLWRAWRRPSYRAFWWQRFGLVPRRQDRPLWIHAVSVGEGIAALPLIHALQQRHPELPILVTSTTPTGRALLRARLGDTVTQLYLPYDLPGAVARFWRRQQPRLGLLMETELWPNLLATARHQRVPVLLLNARLSARSLHGYQRFAGLFAPALAGLDLVAAQSPADAERFALLGAQHVAMLGQLKLDLEISPAQRERGRQWRECFGIRPVWVFASTHGGEEAMAAAILPRLREAVPSLLLVLIPRHPERGEAIAKLMETAGLRVARRSQGQEPDPQMGVFLVDTLGEVVDFCAAADVVSMGGSFVPHGGHNPLEPAALGKAILVGPYMDNFQSLNDDMLSAGAIERCTDEDALLTALRHLLQDPPAALALGQRAADWFAGQRGALERSLQRIQDYVGS